MLKDKRSQIDKIDSEIFSLLEKRFSLCKEIGEYKKANGIKTLDASREGEILAGIPNGEYKENIAKIYGEIFNQSKKIQESGSEK